MNHPNDLKYVTTHEWVKRDADFIITGITDHAQDALGDLVYIEMPEVGSHLDAGVQAGVVESVKTASDIHMPISGTIIEVNEALDEDPDFINDDPYGKGWIYKIKPDNINDIDSLLNSEAYEAGL
ncbi:glycine cleavage system protein GcvH [Acinetobacter pollinis]|uniref:glycine cleavage system protein GcvH n=1 Tax=Acinetobacter pollinis TaxID=2605270 RepID=UPI0018A26812|nr:glycine cleavage system protein GcvH [Acinetobacter pollinis]MBF7689466.1 glycine cleavage system protein GcvH [Acinetobacter pollinis]MBF7692112.1 glycine cleavage system protein GcvH [Acinetobacter pollinis]MBF7696939.1 glycine cleavage system protein GcvH [Acinetobacter pollinis]MBF7700331.1 glycine cleavage system protein GcvH [Acinetobacter pollinis]